MDGETWPASVNHPVTVRTHSRQIFEACGCLGGQLAKGSEMMYLAILKTDWPIKLEEVEAANLTCQYSGGIENRFTLCGNNLLAPLNLLVADEPPLPLLVRGISEVGQRN